MATFLTLKNQVLYWLDEATSTGTTTDTNVENALNQAHQRRLSAEKWAFMLSEPVTFVTSSGTKLYPLHQEFLMPHYFYNQTKKEYLIETPSRQLAASGARWNEDTSGNRFLLSGRSPVQYQPTSGSVITIVSSSASDTTAAKAITVRGETAAGITTEALTPNGTTPVAGSTTFTKILQVTKAAAWVGTMTMTSNGGAVTNLTLFPTEYGRSYAQIYLLFDPSGADTIEYRYYRKPSPLTNDNDLPDIPAPFSQILVWDALLLLSAYNKQLDPSRLKVWGDNIKDLELQMARAFAEGESLESEARYVRYIGADSTWPYGFPG